MKNQDSVQNFIFEEFPVRGELVHLNKSFQQIMDQHQYPPVIRRWLGEALVLVSLLGATLKFKGKIALQFQGKGALKLLLVQCNDQLELRGLAQWEGEVTDALILDSLRQGMIVLTMDPAGSEQRYQGVVAWEGQTLAESIEGYFRNSEQLDTRIWLAVDEKSAAGLLLQRLPQKEDLFMTSEEGWNRVCILTTTITLEELTELENESLIHRLYSEEDIRLFDAKPLSFKCTCSPEKSANAIYMLGKEEAEAELKDKGKIEVKCEFCNAEYSYGRQEVADILQEGESSDGLE